MTLDNAAYDRWERDAEPVAVEPSSAVGTMNYSAAEDDAAVVSFERERQKRGPRWAGAVVPTVCQLVDLPAGWDTYGGQPLKLETGMFALKILNGIMSPRLPVPHVVPIGSGGVQFEWHLPNYDLEIYVAAPYDCEVHYLDRTTGIEENASLTSDFAPLGRVISRIS